MINSPRASRDFKIASTLAWSWGIFVGINALALGLPRFVRGYPIGIPLLLVVISILFCVVGYGVRKQQRYARWLAIIISIISFPLGLRGLFPFSPIGIIIGIVIIVLIMKNWNQGA